jgi:hypothetical protein
MNPNVYFPVVPGATLLTRPSWIKVGLNGWKLGLKAAAWHDLDLLAASSLTMAAARNGDYRN